MNRIKSCIAIAITSLAVTWPFVAVWLSAHQMIRSDTERWTCLFCYFGAFFGAIYYWGQIISKSPKALNVIFAVVVPICAVTLVFQARRHSDRMFAYWIMKGIPPAAWQQMASDIDRVAKSAAVQKEFGIPRNDLPQSFRHLGRADEFSFGTVLDFEGGISGVYVAYGNRNRRWGLATGSNEFFAYLFGNPYTAWSKFKRTAIATNAQFFIGSDW